jgi:hypothetical protein
MQTNELPSTEGAFGKVWLEALEAKFGAVSEIKEVQSPGKPRIYVFYFDDLPEKGYTTAVTCGLSNSTHPAWKFGKPELIVTMKSRSRSWGLAAGIFASTFFDEKRFSYGDMFKLDDPISEEGEMNTYLVFAPSFLDKDAARFELKDRIIHVAGMYPVYDEEIAIYDRIGLKAFWHSEGFEMYNPRRGRVRAG